MPKAWRKQQSTDRYFRKAKDEGYRARSAYKLLEINRRFGLLKPGATVLDLGAAPGSWSQVARQLTGPKGKVVAVDLSSMEPLPGVEVVRGDITSDECLDHLAELLPHGADVVLSDVSPRVSGIPVADQARSIELADASLAAASRLLRPGGSFVVKVFQGPDFAALVARVRKCFERVQVVQPPATRQESSERYVVGLRARVGGPKAEAPDGP